MPRLITLDLGSHAVKGSLYRWTSGRSQLEFEQRFQRFVPQDGVSPTLEHRLAALDALLDDTPDLKPAASDVVVLAWPSNEAAFHRMEMPFADKAQIARTLPFAVESEVPFELSEMVLSWRLAETGLGKSHVLVALARKARVSEWLAALGERGIDPAAVHVDADLFGAWSGGPAVDQALDMALTGEPLVAFVDVGHLHTTVSVVRGGSVQLARSINVGGHAFTRAIVEAVGCSWAEAEQLKHGAGEGEVVPDEEPDSQQVFDADAPQAQLVRHSGYASLPAEARTKLDGAIGLLLAEVRSTLIKAEDTLGAEVSEVRVCGGGARIDELWDYLRADLGVPIVPVSDPRGGPRSPGPFAVCDALGVAWSGGSPPIDLRIGDLAYRGRVDLLRAALGYGVSGALFFSAAALLMFAWQFYSLSVEQTETEAAVREVVSRSFPEAPASALDSMSKAEGLMAQFTEDAVQRANVVSEAGGVPPTIDALYALTKAFPPHPDVTVELSDLTITPTAISFNAETDTFESSAKVEQYLKQNPKFKAAAKGQDVKLTNHVRFPMSIPLGEAAPAGAAGTAAGAGGVTAPSEEG